jgi:hypothetical protein
LKTLEPNSEGYPAKIGAYGPYTEISGIISKSPFDQVRVLLDLTKPAKKKEPKKTNKE